MCGQGTFVHERGTPVWWGGRFLMSEVPLCGFLMSEVPLYGGVGVSYERSTHVWSSCERGTPV